MSQTIARVLGEARVQELREAARGEIVTWVRTAIRRASSAEATEALVLADGTRLLLRPIRREDRDELAALFARLTPESRRRRFLSPKHELTPRELAFLSDVDHVGHEAIAAPPRSCWGHSPPSNSPGDARCSTRAYSPSRSSSHRSPARCSPASP